MHRRQRLTADRALASAVGRHCLSQPGSSAEGVARDLVGLHATSPATPYLSLRARVPGFERTDLDTEMWDTWQLVRFRGMRLAMFVLPRDLVEIVAAATRRLAEPLARRWLRDSTMTEDEFSALADAVDAALADRPATVRDLRRTLGVPPPTDLSGVVGRMCDAGRLVGGAAPGSWRSPVRRYHRWPDVLAGVDLDRWGETAAIEELVRRYVRSYGPVTLTDMAWWTGLAKSTCRRALDSLGDAVEEIDVEGWQGPLYHGADGEPFDVVECVAALPLLDPYVQGYRDRARFLAPHLHDFVYDGGGNSAATLVHDGRIIGVWQPSEDPLPSVRYHLFEEVPVAVRTAAQAELGAAGAMYFDADVDVVNAPEMRPLSAGGGRSAMHPLDGTIHRASQRRPA